jgi:hypothetical protein
MFFFEKKNQKTFVCFGWHRVPCLGPDQFAKVFCFFFFKKEVLPFFYARTPRICAIAYVKSGRFSV